MKKSFKALLSLADNAYFENQEEYKEKAKPAIELIEKFINTKIKEPYSGIFQYTCGIDLTDKYIEAVKAIDPEMKSIKIIMKGAINRTVDRSF